MLALFKDTEAPLINHSLWMREKWRDLLDKGVLPDQTRLEDLWRKEFPESSLPDFTWAHLMSRLWPLERAKEVREIFCHSPHLTEAVGDQVDALENKLDAIDWNLWVETLAVRLKADFNYTHPCHSAHLHFMGLEWRVTLLHTSLQTQDFHKVFFRQISAKVRPLQAFGISDPALLESLMLNHENILIAGSTGSGKTTLMSTLLSMVPEKEHVVMLEDTQELHSTHPRLTRLISTQKEGRSLKDYLAHTLRLSPDRIILGEMRSHEVVPYLLAMNTGHKGLLSTLHASSAMDALLRVAQLFTLASGQKEMNYQEVLKLVCRNVGYVVFMEKRRVTQIIKVFGSEGDQPLFDQIM